MQRGGYDSTHIPCAACGKPANRAPFNWSYIHGGETSGKLSEDALDPERFIDRAEYIDDAYTRGDKMVEKPLKRPMGYKAGIVRSRALQIEREGWEHKTVSKLNELDKRAI